MEVAVQLFVGREMEENMGDMGGAFREHREYMKERKARDGIDCPDCRKVQPKRIPTRLLPGWKCKVCGYRMPNKKITSANAGNQGQLPPGGTDE
jgi:ribosomal protein L37AE/L43A